MRKPIETVRFQVPVPEDLAKAIERLAADMDRSSAWLAIQFLEVALEDRQKFCDWVGLAFMGTAYDTVKRILGRRTRPLSEQKEVRLQLNVPEKLVDEITKLAVQWNQTPVKAAGMLMAAAVHNYEMYIEGIALGKKLYRKTQALRQNAAEPA